MYNNNNNNKYLLGLWNLDSKSKWNLCPNLLLEKKNTVPVKRSKPSKLMLYMRKNIIFKNSDPGQNIERRQHMKRWQLHVNFIKSIFKGVTVICCDKQNVPWAPRIGVLVINNGIGFQSKCFQWTFGRQLDTIKLIAVGSTLRKCQLRNPSFMFRLQKNSRNYETCSSMSPGNRTKFTWQFPPQLGH